MFENFNRPITEAEYDSALDAAISKYERIKTRSDPNVGDKFDIEYLKLLFQEQILQNRYSEETIIEQKKGTLRRVHP